jgi:hypothetical protein
MHSFGVENQSLTKFELAVNRATTREPGGMEALWGVVPERELRAVAMGEIPDNPAS